MANFCDFEFIVKGNEKAAMAVYESTPSLDYCDIDEEIGSDDNFELRFSGNCKWSVNFGVDDDWDGEKIDFSSMSESDVSRVASEFSDKSIRVKSAAFGCEILVHYWSEESEFDQFDQYINGELVKQRKIAYNYLNYEFVDEDNNDNEYPGYDPTDQVYDVCHIQEQNRNEHIETIKKGDTVKIRCAKYEGDNRGIEVFSINGLTLGYLLFPANCFMDNIDDYIATVDYVERLSDRKKKSKRCRVALLKIRLKMKPDKLEEFNRIKTEKTTKSKEKNHTDGRFDWETLEFTGHEGEYDDSVDGEERDRNFMSFLNMLIR